jgi:ribosomal protein S18 acetylase RimI-like enzyme
VLPAEIDLADDVTARAVHTVGLRSYAVEAELIGFDGIPALTETPAEMRDLPLRWLGTSGSDGTPVAFLAWQRTADGEVDIDRLCVDPDWFRLRLATELLLHLLAIEPDGDVLVSTGAANTPALILYERTGFQQIGTTSPAPGLTMAHLRLARNAER